MYPNNLKHSMVSRGKLEEVQDEFAAELMDSNYQANGGYQQEDYFEADNGSQFEENDVVVEELEDQYVPYIRPEMTEASTQVIFDKQDAQVLARPAVESVQITAQPDMLN